MADDEWSLDVLPDEDGRPRDDDRPAAGWPPGVERGGVLVVLLAIVVGLVSLAVPQDPEPARDRAAARAAERPSTVGRLLTVAATLRVPRGLSTISDGAYISLRTDDGRAEVAVTAPSQVAEGAGRYVEMPEDAAAWLRRHPGVHVTRVGGISVAGRRSIQVDYQRAPDPRSPEPARTLSLFCGWPSNRVGSRAAYPPCTRLSATERVRATFVPIANQVLMIEASWTPTGSRMPGESASWQIPDALARSYDALLAGTSLFPGGGPMSPNVRG